jgi:hypothetical protein
MVVTNAEIISPAEGYPITPKSHGVDFLLKHRHLQGIGHNIRKCKADLGELKKRLQQEAKAWYRKRNANQKGVDWQFTTEDARVKLKRLYPQIQML